MKVRACSHSWRGAYLLWKAPGTPDRHSIQASAFVIPVAIAHIAVVRVNTTQERIVATGAHGTLLRVDASKLPGTVKDRDRDRTDDRCRARVLPAVPRLTLMRMALAVLALWDERRFGTHVVAITNQRLACRSPSRIASSSGLRRRARSNAARASSFWPSLM